MATYLELQAITTDPEMLKRVETAIAIAGYNLISSGGATANDRAWAKYVLYNPIPEAEKAWRYIIAKNSAMDIVAITGVTDAQIQTQVNLVVPALVLAMAKA